jgi:spore coat protein CotH
MVMKARLVRAVAVAFIVGLASLGTSTLAQVQFPASLPSDALFNATTLQRIDLRPNSLDWEKLKQNFQTNEFYPADLVFNGETTYNVGIRSRGLGSRSGTKPGLRVDINRYTDDQKFLGMSAFILDNLTQDPSTIHETTTMKLYAKLGIPAPREVHVRLYVNNQYAGLYAAVEEINKQFLARVYGTIGEDVQNDGGLFEFKYTDVWKFAYLGSDLDPYKTRFERRTEENKPDIESYGPIETIVRLANELPPSQYLSVLGERLDLPEFMKFVSTQNYVAENDGFIGYAGLNNFYVYRLENTLKHQIIAWDEDNAFAFPDFGLTTRHDENVLMNKAMQVPELRDMYYNGLKAALNAASEPTGSDQISWLESEIRRQTDLVNDAIRDDPNKPYTFDEFQNARVAMLIFSQQRPGFVSQGLSAAGYSATRVRP